MHICKKRSPFNFSLLSFLLLLLSKHFKFIILMILFNIYNALGGYHNLIHEWYNWMIHHNEVIPMERINYTQLAYTTNTTYLVIRCFGQNDICDINTPTNNISINMSIQLESSILHSQWKPTHSYGADQLGPISIHSKHHNISNYPMFWSEWPQWYQHTHKQHHVNMIVYIVRSLHTP